MNKIDLILDFESIGKDYRTCPIVDCSWLFFDWERFTSNPYTFDELVESATTVKFDVKDQVQNQGRHYRQSDLLWWKRQDKESRRKLMPSEDDVPSYEFIRLFLTSVREYDKIHHWWSRGNPFDGGLLEREMYYCDSWDLFNQYLPFWRIRDTRTWIDAKLNFPIKNSFTPIKDEALWNKMFKGHISSHDIAADVMRLQVITRAENDLDFE